jgi:hypothetical protein
MCFAQSQFLPRHTLTNVFTHSENHLVSFPEVSTPIPTLTLRVTTKSLFRKALLIKLPASLRYDVTTIQLVTEPRDLVFIVRLPKHTAALIDFVTLFLKGDIWNTIFFFITAQ